MNKNKSNWEKQIKLKRALFISSTGGHFSELMRLKPMFDKYDYHIITEKTKTTEDLKNTYKKKIDFLVYGTKDHIFSYIFKVTYNTLKSLFLFIKIRPKIIITTGTHTAVPMCYLGKVFGSKIVFIETFANVETKTMAGKIVYPIADLFIVQWEEMKKLYPKATYLGGVF